MSKFSGSRILLGFLEEYPSVSVLGMCKNAGKTTVLNRLICETDGSNEVTAVTSVGRDGEPTDLVTRTKKPAVYIREGMLFATAAGLLWQCDVTKEILHTTGFFTPLGEVVVIRALSDGFVQLAGPSMTGQLAELRGTFYGLGAGRVLTDGAISRKSLCAPEICDASILCTGASCHRDMELVVKDTAFFAGIMTLAERPGERIPENGGLFFRSGNDTAPVPENISAEEFMRGEPRENSRRLYLNGALTDPFVKKLMSLGEIGEGVELTVRDPGKVLVTREVYEKFVYRGGRITVLRSAYLAAVAVNPVSAYGFHFDKNEFLLRMQNAVKVPVVNVEDLPDVEYKP
jgi:hypothetical protein